MPGTVLLLAASPVGRGRLVDAASVLPVLAAVPPPVLSGTDTANVVELADPLEPQAVLTRLRAAAAAPGPLTVYVVGQLQLDRRQRLPHLALARTTPATVRYTALPWHWLREELRLRPAGATTLLLDLHADPESWDWLRAHPLDCGRNNAVYGRIAPPPARRAVASPAYMKAVATILRSGFRPPADQLHQQALARTAPESAGADLVLTGPGSVSGAVPTGPGPGPGAVPTGPGPSSAPVLTGAGPAPDLVPTGSGPASGGPRGRTSGFAPGGLRDAASGFAPGDRRDGTPGTPGPVPAPASGDRGDRAPGFAPGDLRGRAPGFAPGDPHDEISAAVRAGRHVDADGLAATHELAAVQSHGPGSEEALHWAEVRADLAMFAGDAVRSCRTWLAIASARLSAGQAPDTPAVESAVDRAHHQWGQVDDASTARQLGQELAGLRDRVPGRRVGALDHVRRQLSQLQTQD